MNNTAAEIRMSEAEFNRIRAAVKRHTGIDLSENKIEMVYSRLSKRLRSLGLTRFSDYLRLVEDTAGEELSEFVSAITTNLTHFFREPHHFETLAEEILPAELAAKRARTPIRIWSAGCSTGMEPYSIAMVAHEIVPRNRIQDVRILASDIDRRVLETARRGIYDLGRCENVGDQRLRDWFQRGVRENEGLVRVREEIRRSIKFLPLNLMSNWKLSGPIDIIFCRNVLIYFDAATQRKIVDAFAELLPVGGHLFLGHSESLYRKTDRFEFLQKTTFRKLG